MLKEYITHVVRSLEICGPLNRRDLSEIMNISEDEFAELFGSAQVSPKLGLEHVESLMRFFGGDLFSDSFITKVASFEDTSGGRRRRKMQSLSDAVNGLTHTSSHMLRAYSSYGKDSSSPAGGIAAVRGFASMIESATNVAEIVGFGEEGAAQDDGDEQDDGEGNAASAKEEQTVSA